MILSLSLLQVVILVPIVFLVIAWLYIQWAYQGQLALARKLPTAIPAYPLIGHLLHMKPIFQVGSKTWKLGSGHPSGLSCVWLGPVPWIMINKPEHHKVILNNSNLLGKNDSYSILHYVFGNGLLTAPVDLWKISRKHINPMFRSENLLQYLPVLNNNARHLVEDLLKHDGQDEFDFEDCSFLISLTNMLKLLFGPDLEIDCKSKEIETLSKDVKTLLHQLGERVLNPIFRLDSIYKLLRKEDFNQMENFRKKLKVLTEKSQKQKATAGSIEQMDPGKTFEDIMNQLKDRDPIFNEKYMMDELVTLIITGTDTNAIAVSSFLVALGTHPEIQKNLYEEIISVVGEESEVHPEHIGKMTYLDQVLKETLRYFSIVPFASRRCDSNVQLDGYTIPKGTTVVLSYVGLTHNEVFPDPLNFDPDRFSPENITKRHSYSILPFGGGPRNCIGRNYAMMAVKITLVHLLKYYRIKSKMDIQDITYKFNISMVSINGYKISIEKRV